MADTDRQAMLQSVSARIEAYKEAIRRRSPGLGEQGVQAVLLGDPTGRVLLRFEADLRGDAGAPAAAGHWEEEIRALLPSLKKLLVRNPVPRVLLEAGGVSVSPANFYADTPTIAETIQSFEYRELGGLPYDDERLFDNDRLRAYLRDSLLPYADEFCPAREGDAERPAGFFWDNETFSRSDAVAYYCMVRHARPDRILEVGAGFSTLVAAQALRRNGHGSITVIEPYPRSFLSDIPEVAEIRREKVQDVPLRFFSDFLGAGDILFIDSTHTVKAGSDCLYLYLKVIPSLRRQTLLHVHDVFLPATYPMQWRLEKQIHWTEQYLLNALIVDNPRYEVAFGSTYHLHKNPDLLEELMGGKSAPGGGSFWFRKLPRS